jgi:hypothetical protein
LTGASYSTIVSLNTNSEEPTNLEEGDVDFSFVDYFSPPPLPPHHPRCSNSRACRISAAEPAARTRTRTRTRTHTHTAVSSFRTVAQSLHKNTLTHSLSHTYTQRQREGERETETVVRVLRKCFLHDAHELGRHRRRRCHLRRGARDYGLEVFYLCAHIFKNVSKESIERMRTNFWKTLEFSVEILSNVRDMSNVYDSAM